MEDIPLPQGPNETQPQQQSQTQPAKIVYLSMTPGKIEIPMIPTEKSTGGFNRAVGMKICFNAIVKNEETIMLRRLDNIRHMVDAISITDTGSTDKTIEIIENYGKTHNIPTKVDKSDFINFAYARTMAIRNAEKFLSELSGTWYLMFGDADDLNFGGDPDEAMLLPQENRMLFPDIDRTTLGADMYQVNMASGSSRYLYTWMIKLSKDLTWAWRTPVHEYVYIKENKSNRQPTLGTLKGGFVESRREGDRSKDRLKYLKDAIMFENALLDPTEDKVRCTFYLAQSYRDAGVGMPSYYVYKERAKMGGYTEEIYCCYMNMFLIRKTYKKMGDDDKAISLLFDAIDVNPKRLEAPYELIKIYNNKKHIGRGMHNLAWTIAKGFLECKWEPEFLFTNNLVYDNLWFSEASFSAFYAGDYVWSKRLVMRALASKYISEEQKSNHLKDMEGFYKNIVVPELEEIKIGVSKIVEGFNPKKETQKNEITGNKMSSKTAEELKKELLKNTPSGNKNKKKK